MLTPIVEPPATHTRQPSLQLGPRLWLAGPEHGQQVRLFRGRWTMRAPWTARVRVYAESHYMLWVDGRLVGRGPTASHPHRPGVIEHLEPSLEAGEHIIAVAVRYTGLSSQKAVVSDTPGFWASVVDEAGEALPVTWKATSRSGWSPNGPRRTHSAGYVDLFDTTEAPVGWTRPDHDDAAWDEPEMSVETPRDWRLADVPGLRFGWRDAGGPCAAFQLSGRPEPLQFDQPTAQYAGAVMARDWRPWLEGPAGVESGEAAGGWRLTPPRSMSADDAAVAWCFDLGRAYVGHPALSVTSSGAGVIEVGTAETLRPDGVPELLRKTGSYLHRVQTDGRAFDWQSLDYTGARYLVLIAWGIDAPIVADRWGMITSEPALDWPEPTALPVHRDDPGSMRILAESCLHTLRCGTQESLIDCPTREQSTYIGDSHLIARWMLDTTGDARWWRRLVREQFARPLGCGLVRSAIFSHASRVLIDYDLLAVLGTRDYAIATGDRATAIYVLPRCRAVMDWFVRHRNPAGFFELPAGEPEPIRFEGRYDPAFDRVDPNCVLFIDHPGMGWHNQGDPGIDRRPVNTAIQALLSQALHAQAQMEQWDSAGSADADRWLSTADAIDAAAVATFFDPDHEMFSDARLHDGAFAHASEQTSVWAVAAGWLDDDGARALLRRVFDAGVTGAKCGPYFFGYLLPQLQRLGMDDLAERLMLERYAPMLAGGVDTLWETFAGDHLDSRCHAWSAAPLAWMAGKTRQTGTP
jgi:hypothetical protein